MQLAKNTSDIPKKYFRFPILHCSGKCYFKNVLILLSCICYQPNAWSWLILEYRRVARPFKKFPILYWTRWFITAVTTVGYLSVSRYRWINDTFVLPDSLRAFVILSSYLCRSAELSLSFRFFHKVYYAPHYTVCLSSLRWSSSLTQIVIV
jgi:hypothetical protein